MKTKKFYGAMIVAVFAVARFAVATPGEMVRMIHNPTPENQDYFGYSVVGIGPDIIVGAVSDNTGAERTGSVYLFDGLNGSLLLTINNPTPFYYDSFGTSLASSEDRIIIGAPSYDAPEGGSVYLFSKDLRGTSDVATLTISSPPGAGWFGWSVASSDNRVIVGAPFESTHAAASGAVYLFDALDGSLLLSIDNPTPEMNDNFGWCVAGVEGKILVGAPSDNTNATNAGAVYLFDGVTGALILTVNNPSHHNSDYFGQSVTSLGGNLVVGATGADTVYLFDGGAIGVTDVPLLVMGTNDLGADGLGYSVATLGNNIISGGGGGSAYVFDASLRGVTMAPVFAVSSQTGNDQFGNAVAGVGNNIVVGAPYNSADGPGTGSVYLFCGNEGMCGSSAVRDWVLYE